MQIINFYSYDLNHKSMKYFYGWYHILYFISFDYKIWPCKIALGMHLEELHGLLCTMEEEPDGNLVSNCYYQLIMLNKYNFHISETWNIHHKTTFHFRGEVINGGFGLVLDGSDEAASKAESMLNWDVSNGVARR